MKKQRELNFDLLRILSSIAVIGTHVTSKYMNAATKASVFGEIYTDGLLGTCIYSVLCWFAVPCFVMLSGAFALSDSRNREYSYFYQKTLYRIGFPTTIFSVLYCLYTICLYMTKEPSFQIFLAPILDLLKGDPFYHMWYLFMLIGLYVMVPILIRVKEDIGEEFFEKASWVVLVWSLISESTSSHTINWDIGYAACYLGYFMIGYVLRKYALKRNSLKGSCFILMGITVLLVASLYRYSVLCYAVTDGKSGIAKFISYDPFNALASLMLFYGFANLQFNRGARVLHFLSNHSFILYLFHAGVWDLLFRLLNKKLFPGNNLLMIPLFIVAVFLVSLILAVLYQKIWRGIDERLISSRT